ncbi:MAG: SgcJ/EcaC family oxidoreductase [Chloroflexota bacterium]|nr:SgcJ/EcaC family oxidoreductase [Chloroflexota bacterium]
MAEDTGHHRVNGEGGTREIEALYRRLLAAWNQRDAIVYAALFAEDGYVVGFDGSQMEGQAQIAGDLGGIFADHVTARYVAKVESVRFLAPQVAVLRARAGMVLPGQSDINPAANALQTLTAVNMDGEWRIAVFQNTPAQFHGRPALAEQMSAELRALL